MSKITPEDRASRLNILAKFDELLESGINQANPDFYDEVKLMRDYWEENLDSPRDRFSQPSPELQLVLDRVLKDVP